MLRAAIYARYSTDRQSGASIEDQLRLCRQVAERYGATVIREFADAEVSGFQGARPEFTALLNLARAGGCDVVIAEHTDRLARDGEKGWHVFNLFRALRVRYITAHEGEVTVTSQGVSTLVSELKGEEARHRTRRGLEGVILSGRSAGGMAYGYRAPLVYDAKGDRVRGLREIDPDKAEVVRRIFRDYVAGETPLALADALNREGVTPPRGSHWMASTILGSAERGVGILRNEIYRGVRVWGRALLVKDRETGRRKRLKGSGQLQRVEAPDMRIVDESLWQGAQARLRAYSAPVAGVGQRRPSHLLSGLIRCGVCGGIMTRAGSGDYLRCAARTNRGPSYCGNSRHPRYAAIEASVLAGIEANLLHPLAIDEALRGFKDRIAAERKSSTDPRPGWRRELEDVKRRAERLVREVEAGMPWSAVAARHAELMAQHSALEARLAAPMLADVVKLHTASAREYRAFVADLRGHLVKTDARQAREAVRGLVDEVRFIPKADRRRFELEVTADFAPVLGINLLVEPRATGSCSDRSHEFRIQFRIAG